MKRIIGLLVAVVAISLPSTAGAGGWAVASLDGLPPVTAGEDVDVGFTLLQHGQTPVDAKAWPDADVGVYVRFDGTDLHFVPAVMAGAAGHYVATVAVPDDVTALSLDVDMRNGLVTQGQWFDVAVAAASTADGIGGDPWLPSWTIILFAIGAFGCAAVLIIQAISGRSRPDEGAGEVGVLVR